MEDIQAVIYKAIECMNVELTFGSFTFSALNFYFAVSILSILIWFIRKIFDYYD